MAIATTSSIEQLLGAKAESLLGFKNPKWITAIEVTNEYPGGYWEDRGFNWFAGI